MSRSGSPAFVAWLVVLVMAIVLPLVLGTPYLVETATLSLTYLSLALAFDIVVGRIGALSLAQPVFVGFGAYAAALLSVHQVGGLWLEMVVGVVGATALALVIGVPSFRLSLHVFAIGTLGFALIAQNIANSWMDVTRGPLCVTGIPPIVVPLPTGELSLAGLVPNYYATLLVTATFVVIVMLIARSRLGATFTAVRDDPILASARGLSPTRLRLTAFAISAAMSALVGVIVAHHQRIVCPTQFDLATSVTLLLIVFLGGRRSTRGIATAAVVFTFLPEALRIAESWRLVIFGATLLLTVTTFPDGLEHLYGLPARLIRHRSNSRDLGDGS